jgi:hypothetical protein|tara:strand:- start:3916 stop:4380 length:465 start_codon:yes stop_codon:yes gene_type:complete
MSIVIILLIIIAALFAMTYLTKRRFGVLGLALCAGYLISEMWTAEVTPFVRDIGFEVFSPPLSSIVAAGLVLAPAVLLLFSGPTYGKKLQRLIGAGFFALLATAFLLGPLGNALTLDETSYRIYGFLADNKTFIITAGIIYAIYDVLTLRTPKH